MLHTRPSGVWLTPLLLATVPLIAGQSQCNSNPTPVIVVITSPSDGDFIAGGTATVTGTVNKPPESLDIRVNGVQAIINNEERTWSADVPLDEAAVFNELVAAVPNALLSETDEVTVIAGDSVLDGDLSLEGVALRINDSGLDSLEPVVGSLIDLDLAALLPTGSVIIDNECFVDSIFGCLGRATVRVANPPPTFDSFSTAFDSQVGQVLADIDINGLEINVDIDGSGVVPNCGLRITASGTNIGGLFDLEPMAADPSTVDVVQLGNLAVGFSGFNDEFTSGACDVPIIGDIIQLFLPDIQNVTEDGVRDFLNTPDASGNTPVAAAVEDALAGVDISGPIGASLGADLDAPFFQIIEDDTGLTLGSDVRFVATCTPPPGAPDFSASYSVTDPFPTFGPTTPGGLPYGIGICISTSGMNQLLRAQTECGLLLTSITELELLGTTTPLTTGVLTTFVLAFDVFPPDTPVRIDLQPKFAPVFTGASGPSGEIGELKIDSLIAKVIQNDGTENVFLEFAIDADVGVDLDLDEASNQLAFTLSQPPPTAITVKILANSINADEQQLETILPSILGFFFPSLAEALGGFPVPSFLDLQLSVVEIDRNGEFYSIFADLVPPAAP